MRENSLLNVSFFAAKNANRRQEELTDEAKVFTQEDAAVEFLADISMFFPLVIVATSLIDLFMVIAFQKWFHPWRRIIAKPKEEKMD